MSEENWVKNSWKYKLGQNIKTLLRFSTISLHHKWNGTRLLSPESACTSCLTSCQTT